jgi:Spy/CpxP family protein refolding chaperone
MDRAIQQMVERLGLNEEQAVKVREVIDANVAELDQVRKDTEQLTQTLEKARDAKIRGLLTEEQAEQFKQVQAEREERRTRFRDRMRNRGGDRGRGGRGGSGGGFMGRMLGGDPGQLAEQLELNEEQRQQLQQTMRETMGGIREQMQAVRGDRQAMGQLFAEIREKVQAQIGEILTPEQRSKWEEIRQSAEAQRGARGERGQRGREGRRGRGQQSPEERAGRRMQSLLRDLGATEDELLILQPKIEEILQLDADNGSKAQAARVAIQELVKAEGEVDGEALRAKMDTLRKTREAQSEKRAALEQELRELLTIQQEAVLFLHRVLR